MFAGFMQNAWIAGTTVGVIAGVVGTFVVLRGATFAAHAIPNGAFAGGAAATLVGVNPLGGLAAFALVSAAATAALSRRGRADVATALVLAILLGLGAAFLSQVDNASSTLYSLLFGEVLGVSATQLVPLLVIAVGSTAALAALARPLLLSSIAPDLVSRSRRAVLDAGFLVVLAAATTLTVPVVGALLVFALIVGPPAAARLLASRPLTAVGLSVLLALVTVWGSIALSYESNWPVGFFVGTLSAGVYLVARVATLRAR